MGMVESLLALRGEISWTYNYISRLVTPKLLDYASIPTRNQYNTIVPFIHPISWQKSIHIRLVDHNAGFAACAFNWVFKAPAVGLEANS